MKKYINKLNGFITNINPFNKKDEKYDNIDEILADIKNSITNNSYTTLSMYMEDRRVLNLAVIEKLWNSKIVIGKNTGDIPKLKFSSEYLPVRELIEIKEKMEEFIINVETPFIYQFQELNNLSDGDMSIPEFVNMASGIPVNIDKLSVKVLEEILFGLNGRVTIVNNMLNIDDIMNIVKLGEELKMRLNRKQKMVIGGFVIVAAGVGAYYAYGKYKENKAEDVIDVDTNDLSADVDDLDDPDVI